MVYTLAVVLATAWGAKTFGPGLVAKVKGLVQAGVHLLYSTEHSAAGILRMIQNAGLQVRSRIGV